MGWLGPVAGLDPLEKRRKSLASVGNQIPVLRTCVQYPSCNTDWATLTHEGKLRVYITVHLIMTLNVLSYGQFSSIFICFCQFRLHTYRYKQFEQLLEWIYIPPLPDLQQLLIWLIAVAYVTGSSRRCELFVTAALFVAVHDGRAESKVMWRILP